MASASVNARFCDMLSSAETKDVSLAAQRDLPRVSSILLLIVGLTILRIATAAYLPLSFDEAYFWLWSKRLAISYFEHPPLIAFAVRTGTVLLGDTELGVRLVSLGASLITSWAVWHTAVLTLADRSRAWMACAYLNATLMMASQGMAATPDVFVMAAAAVLLLAVAELETTGSGWWWLAAGFALGAAALAKYTSFFLELSLALWTVGSPQGRRWLATPWPYAAALIPAICLLPNLIWNGAHGWMSFEYQFGRVVAGKPGLAYIFEFIGAQLALASPLILALAVSGLISNSRLSAWRMPISIVTALVWLVIAYFIFHSLHDRVQGNWPSFIYPALAILAAAAESDREGLRRFIHGCRRSALPVACLLLAASYLQAWAGLLPIGKSDPIARMTAVGFEPVAREISLIAETNHAAALVTTRYVTSGWLSFYVRPHLPVLQVNEGYRWSEAPVPSTALLRKPLLYVTQHPDRELRDIAPYFSVVDLKICLPRARNEVFIDFFCIYSLSGFHLNSRIRGALVFVPSSKN